MQGFEIKSLSYYLGAKLAADVATCFSSSQFAKTLRMKIKLKDSSPLANCQLQREKIKIDFEKQNFYIHITQQDIYTGSSNLLGHGQLNPKNLLSVSGDVML